MRHLFSKARGGGGKAGTGQGTRIKENRASSLSFHPVVYSVAAEKERELLFAPIYAHSA